MTATSAPTTTPTPTHTAGSSVVLLTLLLGTFLAGSAEVVTVGLLPLIAPAFAVSLATGGVLFSTYALGLAIGGPLLTALTIRLDRRHVLAGSMVLFAMTAILPAALPHFGWFVVARAVGGALQGVFLAAAFSTATAIVPPDRAGRALAVVISGFSISTVLGLPLGVLAGSSIGWRGTMLVLGAAAFAVAGLLIKVLPTVPAGQPLTLSAVRQALSPRVLGLLGLAVALFAAPGAVMTYLMPLLERLTGLTGPQAGAVLVVYGLGNVAGSFVGGRLADQDSARALVLSTLGLASSAGILLLTARQPIVAVAALIGWAVSGASAPPSIQHRTLRLAGPAGDLMASLPASAASAGIALGSTAGGLAYAAAGPTAVIGTGLIIAMIAIGLAVATRRLQPPLD